jgi:hypothetical protein
MYDNLKENQEIKSGKTINDSRMAACAAVIDAKAAAHSPGTTAQEILEDARGVAYHSVRFCDLNRISDK